MALNDQDHERHAGRHLVPESASNNPSVIRGAALCGFGILIGLVSLVLCCFAFGADFRSEGWGDLNASSPGLRREYLIASLVGFGAAIPLFWVGFFRITHFESR